jgi:multidrug efflux pump subunit AcrA (membrane-fusion protein)
MQSVRTIALWGVVAPCFALALSGAALAQSSPAEQGQTQQLNQNVTNSNAAVDAQTDQNNAQYQAQMQLYQQQLQQYKASRQNYEERSAHYYAARDRYLAAHARYHRDVWSPRFEHSIVVYKAELLGAPVQTSNGRIVGHVEELALSNGRVDAMRVELDRDRGDVWIESADLRFDANIRVVETDLDRHDLYEMTHESF